MAYENLLVFTGNANPALAEGVAKNLGIPLGKAVVSKFSDGEVMVEIRGGSEAFLAQALNMDETYERGERLVVVEYHPPRTVIVARHNKGETIS